MTNVHARRSQGGTGAATITVSDGAQYSINGNSFTSLPATVRPGDTVRLRGRSAEPFDLRQNARQQIEFRTVCPVAQDRDHGHSVQTILVDRNGAADLILLIGSEGSKLGRLDDLLRAFIHGSDHGLSDFDDYLSSLTDFLKL